MVTYKNGQLIIDGKPQLLMSAEIHYYRLKPDEWEHRLTLAKDSGMNVIATYVPWLIHEMQEGSFDFTGVSDPRTNLSAFIKLCEERDFYLFLRPGPFVMAEMKNDGIPHWVYEKHPDAIPVSFDNSEATTPTLDYSHPGYLNCVYNWYRAFFSLASGFAYPKGKLIMIQLDNEVGMLSWVSNRPDLTDNALNEFAIYENKEPCPDFFALCRSPLGVEGTTLQRNFKRFSRIRYANYIRTLRKYAIEFGIKDILFVVNIHGTSGGRGFSYPIGISQLLEALNCRKDVISGSDVYFDEVKINNLADIYLCNEMTRSANLSGRPLTCVEFNCGDNNFGDDLNTRSPAYGTDFRIRLFTAQGNRLLNFYLFCGGQNWQLPYPTNDGNNLIATTGGHHGFAAPVGPTGIPNQIYERMSRVTKQLMGLSDKLATATPVYDDLVYAFVVDDYMTEYKYEKNPHTLEIYKDYEKYRAGNIWDTAVRAALLLGGTPKAILIKQNEVLPSAVTKAKCVILASGKYMSADMQQKWVDYIINGGNLLIQGRLARFDELGNPCTILADTLEANDFIENEWKPRYDPAILSEGFLFGDPEFIQWDFESMSVKNAETILRVFDSGRTVGFYKKMGKGSIVVISCHYKCHPQAYNKIYDRLGVTFALEHDIDTPGIGVFSLMTETPGSERFLHLLNLDDIPKYFNIRFRGEYVVLGRFLHLPPQEALMLPLNVDFGFAKILYSTVEILSVDKSSKAIIFRNTEKFSLIAIETELYPSGSGELRLNIEKGNGCYFIHADNRLSDEELRINFT